MPEAPDVEIYRRYFNKYALNKKIKNIEVLNAKVLRKISAQDFKKWLKGKKFQNARRHGKYLWIDNETDKVLIIHFGMTGFLDYYFSKKRRPRHARALFRFVNHYDLAFINQRLLGHMERASNMEAWKNKKRLGPDVRRIKQKEFLQRLKKSHASVKSFLMDQSALAGIGNIYSDEILFQSGISPKTKCKQLKENQLKEIYQIMKKVIRTAIKRKAQPENMPRSFLLAHRDSDQKCPKGHGSLKRMKFSGRSAYVCPKCQAC